MGQLRIDVRQLQKGFNILLPYKIQFMNTGIQNVVIRIALKWNLDIQNFLNMTLLTLIYCIFLDNMLCT